VDDLQETDASAAATISRDDIQAALKNILSSAAFRNSKRCQDFLRYVVEKTLAGEADTLKERTIGIEVFGKDLAYDASGDPLVRVRAGDIRKRLGMYYFSQPHPSGVVIELPSGSYVPTFRYHVKPGEREAGATSPSVLPEHTELVTAELLPDNPAELAEAKPGVIPGRRGVAVLILTVLLALGVAGFFGLHRASVFDQFWVPVLGSSSRVIVGAAYTPVYLKTDLGIPNDAEYSLASNGYLGGGDLVAASEISGMLGSKHHPFEVRVGDSLSFQDLSAAPSILIGYSVRFWEPLTKDFRYSIKMENGMIEDNGKPTPWIPHNLKHDLHVDDDYAIVVRTFHPQTHEMMILVYGTEQYGTEAAAELITQPDLLTAALKNAPPGWGNKSVQLVLHTKIINNSPAVPEVVASYYW
jgi:hypothetical protein